MFSLDVSFFYLNRAMYYVKVKIIFCAKLREIRPALTFFLLLDISCFLHDVRQSGLLMKSFILIAFYRKLSTV